MTPEKKGKLISAIGYTLVLLLLFIYWPLGIIGYFIFTGWHLYGILK